MNVEEIYSTLSGHMLEGIMFHEQLRNCFLFLGLNGFAKEHEYHYLEETKNHMALNLYFQLHHRGIIRMREIKVNEIIPDSWYTSQKDDVDPATRAKAIKAAFDKWVKWETETKHLYEKAYLDLLEIQEVASANYISTLVGDVDNELVVAMDRLLEIENVSYDPVHTFEIQNKLETIFSKKIRHLFGGGHT